MRCVRCFRPLTSERSISNGMQGSTCRKYIGTMAPSGRAEMYQSFQMRMDKHGEVSQCSKVDYSHLAKGGFHVVTSLYDRDENELIISYVNKNTGEVTSVRFYAEEGKPMYEYETGTVVENVEIGSARDEEIVQQQPPIQEMRNDFVAIHSGDKQSKVDLRQDTQDLYKQYKHFERNNEGSPKQTLIDHISYSPADKSYLAKFVSNNTAIKVEVYAKKGKSMGVTPVCYRVEKDGEITEGFASENDTNWSAIRKESPIVNRLHYEARDTISNEFDIAYAKHKVKWLQQRNPDQSIDTTNQYKGLERGVSVKLAYTHPETKEMVMVMDSAEGRKVIRLYKKENPAPDERPYCYAVHSNGTVDEGKTGDSFMRYYQEESKTIKALVRNYQLQA